jgi:hypothetical protein
MPDGWRYVYGTGDDPSAYTVDWSGFWPICVPAITSPATDFDEAAGGGSGGGPLIGGRLVR